MTRREAVGAVAQAIFDYQNEYSKMGGGIDAYADFILQRLEESGMRPPLNAKDYDYMKDSDRQLLYKFYRFFKWEEE